jgi:multidrug transporter EmrE-like cation transporter
MLAGLIHASWNIAAKKAGGDARFAAFTGVVMTVFWAPLGLWLGWQQVPLWGLVPWAFILASAVLHLVYYLVLLRGYRKADLTVVYPLARGSGPLLSSLVAILLLGERLTLLGAAGIGGVVGGVFLIAGGPALLRATHDPAQRQRVLRGLRYGLLTGAFIAGYTVVDGYAVKVLLMSPILVDYVRQPGAHSAFLLPGRAARPPDGVRRPGRRSGNMRCVVAHVSPIGLRAGAVRHAAGAAVARGAGARGVDAVRRADRRAPARRGRPGAAPGRRSADCGWRHGAGAGLMAAIT